jgi:hypothetical protein
VCVCVCVCVCFPKKKKKNISLDPLPIEYIIPCIDVLSQILRLH